MHKTFFIEISVFSKIEKTKDNIAKFYYTNLTRSIYLNSQSL